MWECLHCGESVEDVFAVCWKCQANRDGTPSELQDPPRDEREEDEIAALGEQPAAFDCLRCQAAMTYAGRRDFHEGPFRGGWTNRLRLRMYVCPDCLRVEFFAVSPNP
jgi:hypothetical protein